MESIVGKILCDRYRIIRELNEDDFSTVYVAEDIDENNEQCYIEQLQPHYDNEVLGERSWRKVLQTFIERSTVLKNLSQHPQIPQLLDFFECDREFYLVREYIQGETLARIGSSSLTEAEAINWLQEILGILEFVHQAKIAHLNIQPSSLIEYRGKKFLTDFATVKNAISSNSNSSPVVINSDFAAPELKLGRPEYSSDIYALGKTIIYALTGRTERIQAWSFAAKGLNSTRSNNSSNISLELANVLNKMISEGVGDRYQNTAEVLADLDLDRDVVTFPTPIFDESNFGSRANSKPKNTLRDRLRVSRPKFGRKIIWSLSALPFIIALAIVFIGINKNSYRRFDNYANDEYEFTVNYPQDWLVKELNDPITGTIVVFNSPIENRSDFQEKVYITVEDLSTEITNLEQYTQTVFDRIEQSEGSNAIDDLKTTIDRFPARTVIYSRQENGLSLQQMETFTIRNGKAYTAIYTAQTAEFSEFSNIARKIIDSWEIQ